jgi:hypothetical protein
MAFKQINLFLRFILEMITLFMAGWWGWSAQSAPIRYLLVIGLPLLLAAVWGIFAVPGDPSRSGKTVVVTPGWIRLIIEFAFFGFGTWTFYDLGFQILALSFVIVVLFHYASWHERIIWLINQ